MSQAKIDYRSAAVARAVGASRRRHDTFCRVLLSLLLTGTVSAQTAWFWREAQVRTPRLDHAACYDEARECVVLFGGTDTGGINPLADTWERHASGWSMRRPTVSPPARDRHAMVYDVARRRTLLFGGRRNNTLLDDTWQWDGETWTQLRPAHTPPARTSHAMAYDRDRQRVVLFGGQGTGIYPYGDTWEWDGTDWQQRTPANAPALRESHAMVYDQARRRTLLYGGSTIGFPYIRHDDTWEWDGTNWARQPGAGPLPLFDHGMTYDQQRGVVVMFGGSTATGWTNGTYEWDGAAWTRRTPTTSPNIQIARGLVYDAGRGQTLHLEPAADWNWDGTTWTTERRPSMNGVYGTPAAYDVARQRVVVWNFVYVSEWDGAQWSQSIVNGPSPRMNHAFAYDEPRQRCVMFGGVRGRGYIADTWAWDGASWTQVPTPSGPMGRSNAAMAFDARRQTVLLFGGISDSGLLADTWSFDGTAWTELRPQTSPPARANAAMAQASAGRIVLFGGTSAAADLGDTWEWDGTTWQPRSSLNSPAPRQRSAMTFDARRGRTWLFGGQSTNGSLADLWHWDGSTWTAVTTPTAPAARHAHAMEYHAASDTVVLVGGSSISGYSDTWTLTPRPAGMVVALGGGCASSATPPHLSCEPPAIGNHQFAIETHDALPAMPGMLALSVAARSLAIGPCTLHLADPMVLVPQQLNAFGYAREVLPIPVDPRLRGQNLYAQAVSLDVNSAPIGLAFTQGLRLTIGD